MLQALQKKPAARLPDAKPRTAVPAEGQGGVHAFAVATHAGGARRPAAVASPPPPPAETLGRRRGASGGALVVRRTCAACAGAEELEQRTGVPQPLCPACEQDREQREGAAVQRRAASTAPVAGAPRPSAPSPLESVRSVVGSGGGRPLDAGTRAFFEARFGHGLGGVRVHTGAAADASARSVNALAYTVGRDLVFRAGEYAPASPAGRRLLAHELAHVVQNGGEGDLQRAASAAAPLTVGRTDDPLEREADAAAEAVLSARAVPARLSTASVSLRRRELPDSATPISLADWTVNDRETTATRWSNACLVNLMANNPGQYTAIPQRRAFYRWFYEYTTARGYTTRWPLAASIVASGAETIAFMNPGLASLGSAFGSMSNELQAMMREGNQVIFDNVFPKLRALLLGGPLTGRAALEWDMRTLSEEQQLIQPLYAGMSVSTRTQLENIARQQGAAATVFGPLMAPTVTPGPHNTGGSIPSFTGADLASVDDRWRYGMQLGNTFTPGGTGFNPATDARPAPAAGYTRGTELARVRTRPNLHQLDAEIDDSASTTAAQVLPILGRLTPAEQRELIADRSPDGDWSYSVRLSVLTRAQMITFLSSLHVSLAGQMEFLYNYFLRVPGRWREMEYSDIAPIILAFPMADRTALHTSYWKQVFIWVCDDDTIVDAVNDLGMVNPLRQQWIDEERSWF